MHVRKCYVMAHNFDTPPHPRLPKKQFPYASPSSPNGPCKPFSLLLFLYIMFYKIVSMATF
jgi:hypothetical protein